MPQKIIPQQWPYRSVLCFEQGKNPSTDRPCVWDADHGILVTADDTVPSDAVVICYAKKRAHIYSVQATAQWLRNRGYPNARAARSLFDND